MCFNVMGELAYQVLDDAGQLFCHPIGYCFSTGNNGPKGGARFMDFEELIEPGGTVLVG